MHVFGRKMGGDRFLVKRFISINLEPLNIYNMSTYTVFEMFCPCQSYMPSATFHSAEDQTPPIPLFSLCDTMPCLRLVLKQASLSRVSLPKG